MFAVVLMINCDNIWDLSRSCGRVLLRGKGRALLRLGELPIPYDGITSDASP